MPNTVPLPPDGAIVFCETSRSEIARLALIDVAEIDPRLEAKLERRPSP